MRCKLGSDNFVLATMLLCNELSHVRRDCRTAVGRVSTAGGMASYPVIGK